MSYVASYRDPEGREWFTLLPDDVDASLAEIGLPYGPPELDELGLPEDIAVRLHHALVERRLLTRADVLARPMDVAAAVHSAFKVTAQRIQALYG